MSLSRSGLRLLVACLAVTGLMALSAGPAQAEKGAFWTANGAKISEALLPGIGVEAHVIFLFSLGGFKIDLLCAATAGVEIHLLEPNAGILGRFKFTGCKLKRLKGGIEEELKSCEPHEGAEKGVILTAPFKGLIVLSGGSGVLLLEPKEGTTLITASLGEECAFGETLKIGGKLALKDAEGKFTTEQVTHELTEDESTTKLFVNGNEANILKIDFRLRIFFTGAHKGLTWAGHPA